LVTDRREPAPVTNGEAQVAVVELLSLDDEALMERFGSWYIPKRDPRYLRRNALVVLGNVGDASSPVVRQLLETYLSSGDDLLTAHAIRAAHQLGRADLVDVTALDSTSPFTAAELAHTSGTG